MVGTNSAPYLKSWGVLIGKIVTGADGEQENINFPVVCDRVQANLREGEKITVLAGPYQGSFVANEVQKSADAVFQTAKLRKV